MCLGSTRTMSRFATCLAVNVQPYWICVSFCTVHCVHCFLCDTRNHCHILVTNAYAYHSCRWRWISRTSSTSVSTNMRRARRKNSLLRTASGSTTVSSAAQSQATAAFACRARSTPAASRRRSPMAYLTVRMQRSLGCCYYVVCATHMCSIPNAAAVDINRYVCFLLRRWPAVNVPKSTEVPHNRTRIAIE